MTDKAKKKIVLKPKATAPQPITNAVAASRLYGKTETANKESANAKAN